MGLFDFLKSKKTRSSWQDFKKQEQKNGINKKRGSYRNYNKNKDPKHPINNQIVMPQKWLKLLSESFGKNTARDKINALENEFKPYILDKIFEVKALKKYWVKTPSTNDTQIIDKAIKYYDLMNNQLSATLHQIGVCVKRQKKAEIYGGVRDVFWETSPRNPKNKK